MSENDTTTWWEYSENIELDKLSEGQRIQYRSFGKGYQRAEIISVSDNGIRIRPEPIPESDVEPMIQTINPRHFNDIVAAECHGSR